ncbi:MAG: hypothetical protein ABIN48_05885 [Ginsengibacter sp.]
MNTLFKRLFCFLCVTVLSTALFAQQKVTEKFKKPVVTVTLGIHQNGDSINKETAKFLLALPLKITDNKKVEYKIENYRFLYRKKSFIQNQETGKLEETFTISAGSFTETPLPKIWIENVGYQLQKGEEFYFFDILLNDKEGNRFLAPNFKLFITR